MSYDPNKPVERIENKVEVEVERTGTTKKAPVEPTKATAESVKALSWSSETMQSHIAMADTIDPVEAMQKIEKLSAADGAAFKNYARLFDSKTLPKQVEAWYLNLDAEGRVVYLFSRWNALKHHTVLATYVPVRGLTREELLRAVHVIISDESGTMELGDVSVVPGVKLSIKQQRQLKQALQSPNLQELFPELSRFVEAV